MALELDDSFLHGDEAQTVEAPAETLDDSFLFQAEEPAAAIAEPIPTPEITAEALKPERVAETPVEQPPQIKPLEQPKEEKPQATWGGRAADIGIDLAKGTVHFGQAIVGLGSLVTGGLLSDGMRALGYEPEETNEFLSNLQSDARKAEELEIQKAEGFTGTAKALLKRPAALAGKVAETAPMMLGSIAAARLFAAKAYASAEAAAISAGASKAAAAKVALEASAKAATTAAAASEGLQQAGGSFDQYLSEGKDLGTAYTASIGSGITTGVTSLIGGRIGQKIGLGDVEAGIPGKGGLVGRIIKGGTQEGVLEEMPQSGMEQAWENYANERPLMEGVEKAAGTGLVVGAAAGGGFSAFQGEAKEGARETIDQSDAPPELFTPTHKAGGGQDVQIVTKDGQIVPDTYVDAQGNVLRDSNAVPVSPDAGDVSMDVNAVAGAIKAEIFGKEAPTPEEIVQPELEPTLAEVPRETIPQVPDEVLPVTPSLDEADRRLTGAHGRVEERRADIDHRRELGEMTEADKHAEIEVLRKERVTDPMTGLGNRTGYNESEKLPVQVSIDADSLKWINDNIGQIEGGDVMLKAIGDAIGKESDNSFHISGDEFFIQANTNEEADAVMAKINARLESAEITVVRPDGVEISKKGLNTTYGLGSTESEANYALKRQKKAKEKRGERASQGQQPAGVAVFATEREQDIVGEIPRGRPIAVDEAAPFPEGEVTPEAKPPAKKKFHKTVDKRFADFEYALDDLQTELIEGGGIALIPDPKFKPGEGDKPGEIPKIRTKSQNPSWFQSLADEEKATVAQVRNALDAAKTGKFLGKKQARIVTTMIDEITAREEQQAERVIELIEAKKPEPKQVEAEEAEPSAIEKLLSKFYSPKEITGFKQETSKLTDSEALEFYEKKYDEGKLQAEKPTKAKKLEPVSKKKAEPAPKAEVEPKVEVKPVEPKPEVKPEPAEPTDKYRAMAGKEISYEVEVADTKEKYTVTVDAGVIMKELDTREEALKELKECI